MGSGDGLIRSSLKELLAQLPEAFVKVHRSAVVNRHFIRAVHRIDDNVELELKSGAERLRERSQPAPVQGDVREAAAVAAMKRKRGKP